MNHAYFNGIFLPKDKISISPDDRGFLFADGVYEVIRWYQRFFYDIDGHMARLKRGLREISINWTEADTFPSVARKLVEDNGLAGKDALVYLQVTRGTADRIHSFPSPPVIPTVYAHAKSFTPGSPGEQKGIAVMLGDDIRWKRCDIKSVALLPNVLCYQSALDNGFSEYAFMRNGFITECTHANIFFFLENTLYTYPESMNILSGITRKNIIRIAREASISIKEEPVHENMIPHLGEAFISGTSAEITPVVRLGRLKISNGMPGPVTRIIKDKFNAEICFLKSKYSGPGLMT